MQHSAADSTQEIQKIKAIALISGGLDSALAAKMVIDQGIEVVALTFHSPFCTCNSQSKVNQCGAAFFAQKLDIPIKSAYKSDEYLEIVKNPRFGYGKNMNPCIDCRINIFHHAKEYMEEIGAEFLITGEVLGQRPKSQMKNALMLIEKEAGLKGRILRPLSAKLLPPTIMEEEGIINRELLMDISGRRRNIQIEMGRSYEIIEQYCAGGGCRLTDANFSRRLRDYFEHTDDPHMVDMKFLKIGRHFRFDDVKIIVGKDELENLQLANWGSDEEVVISVKDINGPNVLVFAPKKQEEIDFAARLAVRYSDSVEKLNEILVIDKKHKFTDFVVEVNDNFKELIPQYRL